MAVRDTTPFLSFSSNLEAETLDVTCPSDYFDLAADGGAATLAIQSRLGLLPHGRSRAAFADCDYFAFAGVLKAISKWQLAKPKATPKP